MKLRTLLLSAAAASAFMGSVAHAQDQDILVMRRSIAPAKDTAPTLEPVEGSDLSGHYWVTSAWLRGPAACTAEAEQTRLRGCVYQGNPADEANCPQPAPEKTRIVEDYRDCDYQWVIVAQGEWQDSCSETTRPVTSVCRRADASNSDVDATFCQGQTKPTEIKGFNEDGCIYDWAIGEWGGWENGCSSETKRKRSVQCLRTNDNNSLASNQNCDSPMPDTEEQGENYSNCLQRWEPTAWIPDEPKCNEEVRQTRTAVCRRSDGLELDPSECTDPMPQLEQFELDYSACSHSWETTEWSDWDSTCSKTSTRTRQISCIREETQESVARTFCSDVSPASEEKTEILTGCEFSWHAGEWSTPAACSANTESTRPVTCRRTDGVVVDDSQCTDTKPADTRQVANYQNCSYGWVATPVGDWSSTCSDAATRSVSVTCKRDDGREADEALCTQPKPNTTETSSVYNGCARDWAYGEWGEWSSTCSSSATRERSVECVEQRPQGDVFVDANSCDPDTVEPPAESTGIFSGCEARWNYGGWGWNDQIGQKSSTCSSEPKQERTAQCRILTASGYQELDAVECGVSEPTERTLDPDYTTCGYTWAPGEWTPWSSTCSPNATRTRVSECVRSDGQSVSTANCDPDHEDAVTFEEAEIVTDCGGLLKNSDFEEGFADWNSHKFNQITSDSYSGESALVHFGMTDQTIITDITAGQTVSVSYYCKKAGGSPFIRFDMRASGTFVGVHDKKCEHDEYREYSFSFTIPVDASNLAFRVYPRSSSNDGDTVIDNIILNID